MAALIGGELIAYYVGKYEFRLTATRHRITRTEWSDVRHPDNLFMSRRIDGQLNPSLSGCHGQIPFVNEREFDAWMRQQARPDHSLPEIQDQRSSGRRERTTPLDVKSKRELEYARIKAHGDALRKKHPHWNSSKIAKYIYKLGGRFREETIRQIIEGRYQPANK
jgi:hypothetical protein